jgi:peptidoglycan hydrolase-like protein with peptidoglycan-binding domain
MALLQHGPTGDVPGPGHGRGGAQCLLRRLGYELGTAGIDGRYGAHTERAVSSLQTLKGLPVNGELGADTWRVLRTMTPGER